MVTQQELDYAQVAFRFLKAARKQFLARNTPESFAEYRTAKSRWKSIAPAIRECIELQLSLFEQEY